ncbi:MAG: tRNA (N(6)-L-threonylcarbamoyladenosine(37)-C(2))-methylthiotransferase MtaB [Clostridia bacterium]|nr:tRNA (N(6)-L-threonylcarbamoyladenosine(37)-C(2))-methylthiotransferase MtaB [Clostridia bacterium]
MSLGITAGICTLGCKVNFYESECIAQLLEAEGVEILPFESVCDAYIVNSCTVTGESDRKVTQMVRRAVRNNPDALVCVVGCMAQVAAERLRAIPGVAFVGGNKEKRAVVDFILSHLCPAREGSQKREGAQQREGGQTTATEVAQSTDFTAFREPVVYVPEFGNRPEYEPLGLSATAHTRAIVKIEDGCNSACAYCLIHTARGPARSRSEEDVLTEVRALAAAGHKEVVLTGIELSSYGGDLPELVRKVGEIDGISRIRLGSLDPAFLTRERIDRLAAVPKLMPHFHISLQSGSSRVLASMRRKYNAATALERIKYLKERFPGACLFADIIVGFPGETEADFSETVQFIQKVRFLHLHIFPFSRRTGTVAATMPGQLTSAQKRARCAELAAIQSGIKRELLEAIVNGETALPKAPAQCPGQRSVPLLEVLFEDEHGGHSREFIEVRLAEEGGAQNGQKNASGGAARGEIRYCQPLYTDGDVIYAVLKD